MSEAAAQAIWDTWCVSSFGIETAPEGGALTWAEMVKAAESGEFPALAEMVALTRLEATNAITAYQKERQSKTMKKIAQKLRGYADSFRNGSNPVEHDMAEDLDEAAELIEHMETYLAATDRLDHFKGVWHERPSKK